MDQIDWFATSNYNVAARQTPELSQTQIPLSNERATNPQTKSQLHSRYDNLIELKTQPDGVASER